MKDDTTKPKRESNGVTLLTHWAAEQEGWVRTIVAEVLAKRTQISEVAIAEVYRRFLVEKGLKDGQANKSPILETPNIAGGERQIFKLRKLSGIKGVNALAENQQIEFHPELTILYGENAAGKTGYSRILKRLAAVRGAEPILTNVHANAASSQSADLSYTLGDVVHEYKWTGASGVMPFTRMGVFDSSIVYLHLDEGLSYLFTPADIALFTHVHSAITDVRHRLQDDIRQHQSTENSFLSRFKRDEEIFPLIETIGAATDLATLKSLAASSGSEEDQLQTLRAKLEDLRPDTSGKNVQSALAEMDFYTRLSGAVSLFANFRWSDLRTSFQAEITAREDLARIGAEAFARFSIPGVLGATWSNLLQAAEAYRSEFGTPLYPQSGDKCLYCQQELVGAALEVVDLCRRHVTGAAHTALDVAQSHIAHLRADLVAVPIASLTKEVLQRLETYGPAVPIVPVLERAKIVLSELSDLQRSIEPGFDISEGVCRGWQTAATIFSATAEAAHMLVSHLKEEAASQEAIRQEVLAKILRLENRVALRDSFEEIEKAVLRAQWRQRASVVERSFQSLLKTITEQAKIASERLLNDEFEKHFARECEALHAPKVTLDFSGKKGQAERKKTIADNSRLSSVLSEGEQKVIALADFLAEMSTGEATSPIVFDDPVNSLDYRRLEHVVERLLDLAGNRQVIVFSHNIVFAISLLNRAKERGVKNSFYQVSRDDGQVGLVSLTAGPRSDSVKELASRVNLLIDIASKSTGDSRTTLIEQAYAVIRSWCEVVVENEMLQGVTKRYQAQVSITQLDKIDVQRFDAFRPVVMTLYKKACRVISAHSQPLETLGVRPTLDDLRNEWKAGMDARSVFLRQ